jgi:hypothetical protein
MTWRTILKDDPIPWLLESDNPSARYLTLTEILNQPPDAPDVAAARSAIPGAPPAATILEAQFPASDAAAGPAGYWIKPDIGYSPKYRATVWQVIFLAQLGAPPVESIQWACDYVLAHSRCGPDQGTCHDGRFVASRGPGGAINCLNGNLVWALQRFGYGTEARLVEARESTARAIARHGFACRYNGNLPCAWGAAKVLSAFLEIPVEQRTPEVETATVEGIELLLSVPLMEATYPAANDVSERWFKLAFPLTYSVDLLEVMTLLTLAGHGHTPAVQSGTQWLLERQDTQGRWTLECAPGKTWGSFGAPGRPNKWVTLRALRLMQLL